MDGHKILIVDDDASVCRVISRVLNSEGMFTVEAQSGPEAVRMMQNLNFDLVILDLIMDGMDGFQVVQQVRALGIQTPIFILSGCQEDNDKVLALGFGADDYVTKPFSTAVLCAKIKACLRRIDRSTSKKEGVLTIGPFCYISDEMRLLKNGYEIPLSNKESLLMKYFMSHPNKILSKEQLYVRVWGDQIVDDNTVMVHIRRLRTKIEDNPDDPVYLKTVRGAGYQFCTR